MKKKSFETEYQKASKAFIFVFCPLKLCNFEIKILVFYIQENLKSIHKKNHFI